MNQFQKLFYNLYFQKSLWNHFKIPNLVQWCYTPNSQSRQQRYHISIWKSIKYQNIWNQINTIEESSWIPPTCFLHPQTLAQYQFRSSTKLSRYMFLLNIIRLIDGAIGSHPLYKCGKSITPIYTYANIYILLLYIIPISLFMKYSRYMFLINNIRLLTAYNVYFNNQ